MGPSDTNQQDAKVPTEAELIVTPTAQATCGLLHNPLRGKTDKEIYDDVDAFVAEKGLNEHQGLFRRGALLAKARSISSEILLDECPWLLEDEKKALGLETEKRWSQPWRLYFLCTLCAGSAIVQGMDQTAVNGAQEFYYHYFEITNPRMQGLLNGAPYLCSVLFGCWSNIWLNRIGGRRFTIFISCFLAVVTGLWQAFANSYWNLFAARFCLGFAIGAKSSTTPVYAAESAPANIRGALTMMWQMWTAFGIALGYVASVAFQHTDHLGENTQWRWMLGSTALPPLFVMLQVYFCPESPRWYMEKGQYMDAFKSSCALRNHPIQAARDIYYAHKQLEIEREQCDGRSIWKEFFTVRRNWRAAQSAWFCMFMQQFCGVNVIAYYSTSIFMAANNTRSTALLVSMGTGIVNWIFAVPAVFTIDRFGRRNLLLVTFPLMALCLLLTGFAFNITDAKARLCTIATGLYLFMVVYSPGAGPVPFTYSAEAFPLHIRDIGMSASTAITWGFNFIISFSWPPMVQGFGNRGAFCWYAGWNVFGWVFAYFFLPETKSRTLEELDQVFSMTNRQHAKYYGSKLPWYAKKFTGQDVEPFLELYAPLKQESASQQSV